MSVLLRGGVLPLLLQDEYYLLPLLPACQHVPSWIIPCVASVFVHAITGSRKGLGMRLSQDNHGYLVTGLGTGLGY